MSDQINLLYDTYMYVPYLHHVDHSRSYEPVFIYLGRRPKRAGLTRDR